MMPNRYAAAIAATALLGLAACTHPPPGHTAHHAGAAAASAPVMPMARMDEQMTAMRAMHDRMARAKSPEERNALMAEHHQLMQDGMGMMGGMGPGPKGGMSGMMGNMQGPGDPAARQQMMEKRMEMMQSMMQMMMDRLPAPAKP